MSDSEPLIAGYLRGDRDAVTRVDGWLAAASAPFRRRLGDDAEDVLQQVRLEALKLFRDGRFRGESSLKTYLWRVACHTCIDALRRQRRGPQLETDDPVVRLESEDPSPLDALLHRERQGYLLAVLEAMSSECRELWRLILRGHGYREIGRRMSVSEGALRVRAHRCRKRALEVLDGD